MSLEHKVRYAEIISAAAVVISLIFVGLEIRQSNDLAASQAALSLNSEINETHHLVADDASLAELFAKVYAGDEAFSMAEMLRLQSFGLSRINTWEAAWIAHDREIIDDDSFAAYMAAACVDIEHMRDLWNSMQSNFNSVFVKFIDSHCTED